MQPLTDCVGFFPEWLQRCEGEIGSRYSNRIGGCAVLDLSFLFMVGVNARVSVLIDLGSDASAWRRRSTHTALTCEVDRSAFGSSDVLCWVCFLLVLVKI